MEEIATIKFIDSGSNDNGVAIIRAAKNAVGLCLSLIKDGDIEVYLNPTDCEKLLAALQTAVAVSKTL